MKMSKFLKVCNFLIVLLYTQQVDSNLKSNARYESIRPQNEATNFQLENLIKNRLRSTIETQRISIEMPFSERDFENTESVEHKNKTDEYNNPLNVETETISQENTVKSINNLMDKMNETMHLLKQQFNDTKQQYEKLIEEQKELKLSRKSDDAKVDLRIHDEHLNCLQNCTLMSDEASCSEMSTPQDGAFVFKIPNSDLLPFYTYCRRIDNTSSWTVIQRREDGSVNFNRGWHDYKYGFGDVYGEYWIGLERLHALTNSRDYELQIYLEDFDNLQRYAKYSKFKVASENEGYMLTLGAYSGDVTDSLSYHNSMKFTTYDRKNDEQLYNCAQRTKGGWWFKKCYRSNLNGRYFLSSDKKQYGGVRWIDWKNESLGRVIMQIRPL